MATGGKIVKMEKTVGCLILDGKNRKKLIAFLETSRILNKIIKIATMQNMAEKQITRKPAFIPVNFEIYRFCELPKDYKHFPTIFTV